jgi:cell division septation protein DedD
MLAFLFIALLFKLMEVIKQDDVSLDNPSGSKKQSLKTSKDYDFYHLLTDPHQTAGLDKKTENIHPFSAIYLQAGSFQHSDQASLLVDQLNKASYQAYVEKIYLQEKVWYRVRLGPFDRMIDMKKAKDDLLVLGIRAEER